MLELQLVDSHRRHTNRWRWTVENGADCVQYAPLRPLSWALSEGSRAHDCAERLLWVTGISKLSNCVLCAPSKPNLSWWCLISDFELFQLKQTKSQLGERFETLKSMIDEQIFQNLEEFDIRIRWNGRESIESDKETCTRMHAWVWIYPLLIERKHNVFFNL